MQLPADLVTLPGNSVVKSFVDIWAKVKAAIEHAKDVQK